MEFIDTFYFINLNRRKDRFEQIIGELNKMEIPHTKVIRVEAVEEKIGILGCAKSHACAVKHFISTGKKRCMIMEDDFEFTETKEKVNELLTKIFQSGHDIDCLMLAGTPNCVAPAENEAIFATKVYYASSPSCYVITKNYAPCLHHNLSEGIEKQEKWINAFGKPENMFNNDLYWIWEQINNNFFMTVPLLGRQRDSPSDITGSSNITIKTLRALRNFDLNG
jgi:GR25 family glycosyltransferase involved in LPS biosynthesis